MNSLELFERGTEEGKKKRAVTVSNHRPAGPAATFALRATAARKPEGTSESSGRSRIPRRLATARDYRLATTDSRLPTALLAEVAGARPERFLGLDEVLHVALQLELLVARLHRRRRRRRLVRRNRDVPVELEAGARRNQ